MKRAADDDDSTIKLKRPGAFSRPPAPVRWTPVRLGLWAASAFVVVGGIGAAGWILWPRASVPLAVNADLAAAPPVAAPPAAVVPATPVPAAPVPAAQAPPEGVSRSISVNPIPAPRPPAFTIETATEQQVLNNVSANLSVFRFAANPNILILDFASLTDQGAMLNRLGAFAEKMGLPHDHLLQDAELDQAIRRGGDTPETYYYGHDYSAETIRRFFFLADRDHIALNAREEELRRLMTQVGWLTEGRNGGLISIPRVGADLRVTAIARATILHHELSHGEYFSNPAYVAYAHRFWTTVLTEKERDAMRRYLGTDEYDTKLEDLIENEAQAYLVFTPNSAFFSPAKIGMSDVRRAKLQAIFMRNVPAAWMHEPAPSQATFTTGR